MPVAEASGRRRTVGPWLSALALALVSSCATADTLEPRHVGDRCFEVCPEGMVCRASTVAVGEKKTDPGRCELGPDRCLADLDCHSQQPAHCIGASRADIGFCAYGLPF